MNGTRTGYGSGEGRLDERTPRGLENKDNLSTINCTREERVTVKMYFLDKRRGRD